MTIKKVDGKSADEHIKLTRKEEAFAQNFVQYGVASKAYREAYDTKTASQGTVWTSAYKVRVKPHVNLRIEELIEERKKSIHIDREKIALGILELIENAKKFNADGIRVDGKVLMKGFEMLGKLYDLNQDAQEDRVVITNQNKEALVESLKERIKGG